MRPPTERNPMHIETAEQSFRIHADLLQTQAQIANARIIHANDQAMQLELDRLQTENARLQKEVYEIYMTKFAQN